MNSDKILLGIILLLCGLLGYYDIQELMCLAVGVGVSLILIGSLTNEAK